MYEHRDRDEKRTDKEINRERDLCANRLISSCGTVCILRT